MLRRIAARVRQVAGVEQQAHCFAGVGHHAVDVLRRLHHRAHVMVIGHAQSFALHALARARSAARRSAAHSRLRQGADAATAARAGRRACSARPRRTPSPRNPSACSSSKCARIAAHSASTSRSSSRPLYQPETRSRSCARRIGAQHRWPARGNLLPSSTPVNPASRASRRQVSRVVSAPSDGRSSLVQVSGLMPMRTAHDQSSSRLRAIAGVRRARLRRCRRLRAPPRPTRRRRWPCCAPGRCRSR